MSTPAVVKITSNSGPAVVRILPPGAYVALSDATPQSLGTAAAGTGTAASRSDHRHAMPSAADIGAADKANNLSDLLDLDQARTNIGAARAGIINFSGITASGLVLVGRYSTGVGGLQEINLGTGLSFTGSVLNGFDRTNPGVIGGTTAAAGSFTALLASTSLLLPNTAGTAAGHAYRSGDTIRYRDSSNVERLLLNSADNLANLGNTATARSNLGLGLLAPVSTNTIVQRDGTNAQKFFIFNTYTNDSNYEQGFTRWNTNLFQIGTENAGSGVTRDLELYRGTERRITLTSTGTRFGRTGAYPSAYIEARDISSATAPFTQSTAGLGLFFTTYTGSNCGAIYSSNGGEFVIESNGGARINLGSSNVSITNLFLSNSGSIYTPSLAIYGAGGKESGFYRDSFGSAASERFFATVNRIEVLTFAATSLTIKDVVPLCFGGISSSYPALKRSSTTLQVRLADDSAFATIDALHRLQGTAPAAATSTGTAGDIRYDGSYVYVCTATNTWARAALSTW